MSSWTGLAFSQRFRRRNVNPLWPSSQPRWSDGYAREAVAVAVRSVVEHLQPSLSSMLRRGDGVLMKVNMGCMGVPKSRRPRHLTSGLCGSDHRMSAGSRRSRHLRRRRRSVCSVSAHMGEDRDGGCCEADRGILGRLRPGWRSGGSCGRFVPMVASLDTRMISQTDVQGNRVRFTRTQRYTNQLSSKGARTLGTRQHEAPKGCSQFVLELMLFKAPSSNLGKAFNAETGVLLFQSRNEDRSGCKCQI